MLYLVFSAVIAWLVYSIASMSAKQTKIQNQILSRIEDLENKISKK